MESLAGVRVSDSLVSRRRFIESCLAAGLGLEAIGVALASCRQQPAERLDASVLGEIEGNLALYIWSDYLGEATVPNFEREFKVGVTVDTYESNEEMLAKVTAGGAGYDLICPSGYSLPVLRALNLLAPLRREYLKNWSHLSSEFLSQPYDSGNLYSMPWLWGTTGIAYRSDRVAQAPDSWGVFHEVRYAGKMTQMDDPREVIGSWLRYRGYSLNSTDVAELRQAKADALLAKPLLKSYVAAPVKSQLIAGDVYIAQLYNGDAEQARREERAISYLVPKEGSTLWMDALAILRTAKHMRAAHEFMNYVLRPEVGAELSDRTGFGSPNRAALEVQRHPIRPPTSEELARLEYQEDLGEATELWDRIWTEIKAG